MLAFHSEKVGKPQRKSMPKFSLAPSANLDLGKLKDLTALTRFLDAWRAKAADIAIVGAPGSAQRQALLRLRAE